PQGHDPRGCELRHLLPLADIAGVQLFSLQKGATGSEQAVLRTRGVVDLAGALRTWDDTAALMSSLDAVIATDSGPLHLAGALGRPTLALLSTPSDWRWGVESHSVWYSSAVLCRQPRPGDWTGAVNRVAEELRVMGRGGAVLA